MKSSDVTSPRRYEIPTNINIEKIKWIPKFQNQFFLSKPKFPIAPHIIFGHDHENKDKEKSLSSKFRPSSVAVCECS